MSASDSRWDAVLFDLDGTLANTIPLILASFRKAMGQVRPGGAVDESKLLANVGRTLVATLGEFSTDPEEIDSLRAAYVAAQDVLHDEMVTPYPGALSLLEGLRSKSVPIAIVTSKGRPMTARTMRICGLDPHFEHVVTAHDVKKAKPDPEPVHRALSLLGVDAGPRVAFIGDSVHDIVAGRHAGVTTIGVSWGAGDLHVLQNESPDHLIHEFDAFRSLSPGR